MALLGPSNDILEKYPYDANGTPTITDANGNVRFESAYGNRFMFTGREYIIELGTRALDAIATAPEVKQGREGGGVFFENGTMRREFGTTGRMAIHLLPGAIGTYHVHHLVGPNPYDWSPEDLFNIVHKRPNWVHLLGILDGPPGKFTIWVSYPDHGEGGGGYWQRSNEHTPTR